MVFNDYVEKTEHRTLISDVNVNVTFSKTKKDMNIKKKQHSTYFTAFQQEGRSKPRVTSEYDAAESVLQFIKNKNHRYQLYRYMGIDISVCSFGLHFSYLVELNLAF